MTRTIRGISVPLACAMLFNEPGLNQSIVHLTTAGVPIERFAERRARRTLRQSVDARVVLIEGCVIGIPMMGLLRVRIAWRSEWEAA